MNSTQGDERGGKPVPEVIAGRFELLEHIASGGSGAVWVARDRKAGKLCAAKVMRQSYSGELLRFVREQGVKFAHPHLLTPYGWAAEDDQVVIATDLMRGGSQPVYTACFRTQFGCDGNAAIKFDYNPAKAKQLLAEAGYPNGFDTDIYAYREREVAEEEGVALTEQELQGLKELLG